MNADFWIPALGLAATMLLVMVGLDEGLNPEETQRRRELLGIFENSKAANPIDYTVLTMQRRR